MLTNFSGNCLPPFKAASSIFLRNCYIEQSKVIKVVAFLPSIDQEWVWSKKLDKYVKEILFLKILWPESQSTARYRKAHILKTNRNYFYRRGINFWDCFHSVYPSFWPLLSPSAPVALSSRFLLLSFSLTLSRAPSPVFLFSLSLPLFLIFSFLSQALQIALSCSKRTTKRMEIRRNCKNSDCQRCETEKEIN